MSSPPLPPFLTLTSSLVVPINWTVTATFCLEIILSQCICLQTVCLDPDGIRGNACVTYFLPIGCRVLSPQLPVNIFFRRQTYWWVDLHIVKWTLVLGDPNGAWLQYAWHWGICKDVSYLQFLVLRNDSGKKLNLSLCDVCKAKCISFAILASNGTRLFTLTCQNGAHEEYNAYILHHLSGPPGQLAAFPGMKMTFTWLIKLRRKIPMDTHE